MTVRELTAAEVAAHADELLRIQVAAFRIEAEILGHDRIPYLYETVEDITAPGLRWIADVVEHADPSTVRTGDTGSIDTIAEVRGAVVLAQRQAGLFVTRVIVDPAHHRKGVASGLLGQAQELGQRLFVITSQDNPPGIGMYRKAGFARVRDVEIDTGSILTEYAWEPAAG
ncbi:MULTISPECIES: GNAT family N-acetyltransferase [Brevibacterium]|uniref:N-acetyltransferase domain-containing protein n=1 Tax=Brevibacterium pityocampae TaxID=506594 RepID=A0ABP8JMH0_9MICO|nr:MULTISPECIES: GNAT family N-acetyltransferase [Actinomycetes]MCK1803813.1 GNAT family N-acetyltransferase [Brevibacterium sp. R8603A2]MCX0278019.1 GNAT family N-acetyltransferase [Nocardia zapadnayensis]QCP05231.1 GNAT family N-acetyltransferase [Brevibacterium sp. CS2]